MKLFVGMDVSSKDMKACSMMEATTVYSWHPTMFFHEEA